MKGPDYTFVAPTFSGTKRHPGVTKADIAIRVARDKQIFHRWMELDGCNLSSKLNDIGSSYVGREAETRVVLYYSSIFTASNF